MYTGSICPQYVFHLLPGFSDKFQDFDGPLAVGPDQDICALSPADCGYELIGIIVFSGSRSACCSGVMIVPVKESFDDVKLKIEKRFGQTLEVDIERVVLRPTRYVVAISGKPYEILLIGVS